MASQLSLPLIDKSIGAAIGPFARLKQTLKGLGTSPDFEKIKKSFEKTSKAAGEVGKEIANLVPKIAAGGEIIGRLLKETAATGAGFAQLSRQTGVTTGTLSRYALSAQQAGVSNADVGKGFRNLFEVMSQARQGNTDSQAAFGKLGISLENIKGRMKSTNQVLLEVSDRFSQMPDDTEKATLAMQLFGESGKNLIPFLDLGAKAIRANQREAERLGLTWSQEDAAAADKFNKSLGTLQGAFTGVIKKVATDLFPKLTPLIDKLADWVAKNRELIASDISKFLKKVVDGVLALWDKLDKLGKIVGPLIDWFGLGNSILLAMGLIVGGPLIASVVSLIAAFLNLGTALFGFIRVVAGPMIGWVLRLSWEFLRFGARHLWSVMRWVGRLGASFIRFGVNAVGTLITWIARLSGVFLRLGVAMLASPITWLVIGLGSIYLAYKRISAALEEAGGWGAVWEDIKRVSGPIIEYFVEKFQSLRDWIKDLIDSPMKFFLSSSSAVASNEAAAAATGNGALAAAGGQVSGGIYVSILDDRVRIKSIQTDGPLDVSANVGPMRPAFA